MVTRLVAPVFHVADIRGIKQIVSNDALRMKEDFSYSHVLNLDNKLTVKLL